MRICMLAPEFIPNWGGVGTYIVEIVKHLPNDFEIFIITPDRGENSISNLHNRLLIIKTSKANDTFVYNLKFQYSCLRKVLELIRDKRIDVIHSHTAHMPDLFLTFKKLNVATVTTIHSTIKLQRKGSKMGTSFWNAEFSEKMTQLFYPFLRFTEDLYFLKERNYIAVSNWMKNYFLQEYGLNSELIYNSVDANLFCKRKKFKYINPEIYEGKKIAIYCGRLIGLKGVGIIIKSMKELIQSHKDMIFLFAGKGNLPYFENLVRNFRIPKENYRFLGHINYDQLVEYYSISDIFILPSFHENMPTSLLEAMACKLPSIATNVGGIPEIIQNGINGFIINPNDTKELIDKIEYIFDNQDEINKIGTKARKQIEEKFTWEKNIKKIVQLYEHVSGSGN